MTGLKIIPIHKNVLCDEIWFPLGRDFAMTPVRYIQRDVVIWRVVQDFQKVLSITEEPL